jgi:hypothetical protein
VTTYTNNNPSFNVIEIDAELMIPLNFKVYYFNITEANLGNPQWKFLHDFVNDYGIPDVSPAGLFTLA